MKKLGNKSVFVGADDLLELLQQASVPGKRLLEPLKAFAKAEGLPLNILEDVEVSNDAEVHTHEGDLWQCLQGEATFVVGGEMVGAQAKINKDGTTDEREWSAKEIKGGSEVVLRAGDWLWIPPGEPHQHRAAHTARLAIIKIPKGA